MKLKLFLSLLLAWGAFVIQDADCAEKKDPKTLVLIICSDDLPLYKRLQQVWKSYMHEDPEHFECYFIRSDPKLSSEFLIKKDVIWSKGQESLIPGLLNKTLLSLEAMLPRLDEFDYVLRANLSSFFVFPRLLNFLKTAPKEKLYCGVRNGYGTHDHEAGWICGAGILMSLDLAKMLLKDKEKLFDLDQPPNDCSNMDDIVIGSLFTKNGIQIQPGLCTEIYSVGDWNKIADSMPEGIYHFRIKTLDPMRLRVEPSMHASLLAHFYNKQIYIGP